MKRMTSSRQNLLAILLLSFSPLVFGAHGPCDEDLDRCVIRVIAETATFFDECAKSYPKNKSEIEAAFQAWSVLKLPIPGLEEALNQNSQLRQSLARDVGPYFARIPGYEKEIECIGRIEMVRNPTPTLQGDSAKLPADALSKYAK
ncbi:hypothetical protein GTP46_21920 [Duganella sp. FT135W]|uniref:Uncharacterized protein n=1 Tax=Duganella flavida TaxID=2692175 RepID=A0A6L8KHL3_9BURK|nr:hypothetical protein [Duganella flavida]MYM25292.1 hypothetical protein [Duganella flavida]